MLETARIMYTDFLVTMMLGTILIIQLLTGEKYKERLQIGKTLAAEWKEKKQQLQLRSRMFLRRAGFITAGTCFLILVVASFIPEQLRGWINTPELPILFSEILLADVLIIGLSLYVALTNLER